MTNDNVYLANMLLFSKQRFTELEKIKERVQLCLKA